jgi:hypothetical protein
MNSIIPSGIYFPKTIPPSSSEVGTFCPPEPKQTNLDYFKFQKIKLRDSLIFHISNGASSNSIDAFKEVALNQKSKKELLIYKESRELTILNQLLFELFQRKDGLYVKSQDEREDLLNHILSRFTFDQISMLDVILIQIHHVGI